MLAVTGVLWEVCLLEQRAFDHCKLTVGRSEDTRARRQMLLNVPHTLTRHSIPLTSRPPQLSQADPKTLTLAYSWANQPGTVYLILECDLSRHGLNTAPKVKPEWLSRDSFPTS